MNKKILSVILSAAAIAGIISGCAKQADVASRNISNAADSFEINRRIVFYNGITGDYMLEITGLCSIGNYDSSNEVSITCKIGPTEYVKHYLGLSDNVTYFAEQIKPVAADPFHYRVIFNPATIIPDIDIQVP
jgi:hypothetical protein